MIDGRKIAVLKKERERSVGGVGGGARHGRGAGEKNKLAGSSVRYERNALMVGKKSRKNKSAGGQNVRLFPSRSGQMDYADPRYLASEPTRLSFLLSFITSPLREVSVRCFLH